jgi:tetratricopeptide (TPR) repeat protein
MNLGLAYNDLGRYEEALEELNHAISISPAFTTTYMVKSSVLLLLGRAEEAIDTLNTLLSLDNKLKSIPLEFIHSEKSRCYL